ncbi:uncharacterized protein PHALS_04579 [Plasmopara halstedii]|uniref:RxLR-like protein n=1 Tax=Plasmopara halstedii TaxID=4781 RepID=A0A0P1A9Q5_PLAHL|nr:uncharacterized protein PHALS_04579 [Plasmopara halstedii]CEG37126.1 hypothetical protein PHALS_04579 [Plasmopara halstedii]|eukprot:XP_024573495.1 hypothetical protein PHALS_04579 [Plasmopara halstedii]
MKFFAAICITAAIATQSVVAQNDSATTIPPSAQGMVGQVVNEITEMFGSASYEDSGSGSGNGTTTVGDDSNMDSEDSGASIQMVTFATSAIAVMITAALV